MAGKFAITSAIKPNIATTIDGLFLALKIATKEAKKHKKHTKQNPNKAKAIN